MQALSTKANPTLDLAAAIGVFVDAAIRQTAVIARSDPNCWASCASDHHAVMSHGELLSARGMHGWDHTYVFSSILQWTLDRTATKQAHTPIHRKSVGYYLDPTRSYRCHTIGIGHDYSVMRECNQV